MSASVIYTAPDGTENMDPDAEWLERLICHEDDSYWATGSGDAGLRFLVDDEKVAEMILVIRNSLGAMVHHLYSADGREYVMNEPALGTSEVTIRHGGNPWTLPRSFFIDRNAALVAVKRFLKDGKRVEGAEWAEY